MQNERFAVRQGFTNSRILLTFLVLGNMTLSILDRVFGGAAYILPHFAVWVKTIFQVRCDGKIMGKMVFQSRGVLW